MKKIVALAVILAFTSTLNAGTSDWNVSGTVTVIEATYMPGSVDFQISTNAGTSCPAGSFLTYYGQGPDAASQAENVKAVYALLLSAKLSGSTVNLFGNNAGCVVTYVWIM